MPGLITQEPWYSKIQDSFLRFIGPRIHQAMACFLHGIFSAIFMFIPYHLISSCKMYLITNPFLFGIRMGLINWLITHFGLPACDTLLLWLCDKLSKRLIHFICPSSSRGIVLICFDSFWELLGSAPVLRSQSKRCHVHHMALFGFFSGSGPGVW